MINERKRPLHPRRHPSPPCALAILCFCLALAIYPLNLHGAVAFSQPLLKHATTPRIGVPTSRRPILGAGSVGLGAVSVTVLQGDVLRTAAGAALAARISVSAYRKKRSLSRSGAIAAFAVASLSLGCSVRCGATLLAFYATSSKLTKLGSKSKEKLEEAYDPGGRRDAQQVLACSAVGVACGLVRRLVVGPDGPLDLASAAAVGSMGNRLTAAYVAFFACCAGDTWASELGVLSRSNPRMVTRLWETVAPGTNGAVSNIGLAASAAGGTVMGLVHALFLSPFSGPIELSWCTRAREVAALSAVGLVGGLGGSLLDSLLGATIQATYYDPVEKVILKKPTETSQQLGGMAFLSNEMVNVVSTAATAVLAALYTKPLLSRFAL